MTNGTTNEMHELECHSSSFAGSFSSLPFWCSFQNYYWLQSMRKQMAFGKGISSFISFAIDLNTIDPTY